ncbi:MAG: J domain-containing protein [Bacteroidota bacterium]|nr:J domain-containing protein [Bacteroidota bacterium]
MHLKDYYSILQLEPSATLPEIKKAYRKLALQYHPDKNQNDPYSSAQFTEIKEAYEILTNPAKKEYYLQQRWYNQSVGKRKSQDVITPVTILKQALELEKYVFALDTFRMDKEGLKEYILGLLPDSAIDQLKKFNEPETIRQIIITIIKAMNPLPQAYTGTVITQLEKLSSGDKLARSALTIFTKKIAKKSRREKYSLIIIIAATIILCLLIWLAGR